MKVSFIIPAYNEEGILGACLESVQREIAHGRYEAEIIVVNNASTDRTAEIARGFSEVRVVNEQHKGLTHARQAGYRASSGDLIANIDADTVIPEGWLATVMSEFERNPNLVALSGPFVYHDLPFLKRTLANLFITTYPLVNFIVQHILHAGAILQGGNFVLRRTALAKIGGYDTSIEFYGEDTDIARRISKVGEVKWTLRFPIYASGRRLQKEGLLGTGFRYALNFFWTIIFRKPYTLEHYDIRTKK